MSITKLLKIKYPLIQGGMANISTAKFAATISNSGGLGIIASGAMTPEVLEEAVKECQQLTDKPFGVNLMLMNPHCDQFVDLIIKYQVAVVTTGAGSPGIYMERLKAAGVTVIPVVPTVALARRMERLGADAIIVEGTEAGGHVGEATTMALVPQVVEKINVPVIAAGGIASGKQLLAAFALGASGVQVGTCLLVAEECPIHENYKKAVIKAKDNDTTVTGRIAGVPVRIYKNKMARSYVELEREGKSKEELEHLTLGALRKAVFDGDTDNGSLMMGQIAGMLEEVKPAKEIIDSLFIEMDQELLRLQQGVL